VLASSDRQRSEPDDLPADEVAPVANDSLWLGLRAHDDKWIVRRASSAAGSRTLVRKRSGVSPGTTPSGDDDFRLITLRTASRRLAGRTDNANRRRCGGPLCSWGTFRPNVPSRAGRTGIPFRTSRAYIAFGSGRAGSTWISFRSLVARTKTGSHSEHQCQIAESHTPAPNMIRPSHF
jgi:hypothetical protein